MNTLTRADIDHFRRHCLLGRRVPDDERLDAVCDMAILSLALAEALEKMGWIPVTERLPDGPAEVLVYINGSWGVGVTCAYFADGKFGIYDQTTHWQPLPVPPVSAQTRRGEG